MWVFVSIYWIWFECSQLRPFNKFGYLTKSLCFVDQWLCCLHLNPGPGGEQIAEVTKPGGSVHHQTELVKADFLICRKQDWTRHSCQSLWVTLHLPQQHHRAPCGWAAADQDGLQVCVVQCQGDHDNSSVESSRE